MTRAGRGGFARYAIGVLSVWAILIAAFAIATLAIPHDPANEPVIGTTAMFFVATVPLSILYFIVTFGVYLLASIASDGRSDDAS